jgi:hypothetical protein
MIRYGCIDSVKKLVWKSTAGVPPGDRGWTALIIGFIEIWLKIFV